MPTKALETILYRDLSKVEAKDVIDIASPLLEELVNYSTNAYARCLTSASGEENEDLAVLMLYQHLVEMTDGVEVLIAQSCPTPAILLVRSSFEALISIEYILEADYARHSLSWFAGYVRQMLVSLKALDSSTTEGQDFQNAIQDDAWLDSDIMTRLDSFELETSEDITNLHKLLGKPQFQAIEEEFANYKRKRKRRPEWYQLFDGPTNLRNLARHVRRHAQYDFLYRKWSRITHAQDMSRFLNTRLRDGSVIKEVATFSSCFILDGTRRTLGKLRPGEDLGAWYKAEVQDRFRILTKARGP